MDNVRDDMAARICPTCKATVYSGEFHQCYYEDPEKISREVELQTELEVMTTCRDHWKISYRDVKAKLDIAKKALDDMLSLYDDANKDDSQLSNKLANEICDISENALIEIARLEA